MSEATTYKRLGFEEFQTMFQMHRDGEKIQAIATRLQRSTSTVCRALHEYRCHKPWRRGRWSSVEQAEYAERIQRQRRRRSRVGMRKLKDEQSQSYVIKALLNKISPELISGRMRQQQRADTVSANTIRSFIRTLPPQRRDAIIAALPCKGKPYRSKPLSRRGIFSKQAAPTKKHIEDRPLQVLQREEIGHWEIDAIVSARGTSTYALIVMAERKTRHVEVSRVASLQSVHVRGALRALIERLPRNMVKTLTMDNGAEFAVSSTAELERLVQGLEVYYCNPYAPHEKGTVENRNKLLRFHFPKGTDFATITNQQVRAAQHWINNRPMRLLGFASPDECFYAELASMERLSSAA